MSSEGPYLMRPTKWTPPAGGSRRAVTFRSGKRGADGEVAEFIAKFSERTRHENHC